MLSHLRGEFLIIWIPACAGMTQFFLMDYLGLTVDARRTVPLLPHHNQRADKFVTYAAHRLQGIAAVIQARQFAP